MDQEEVSLPATAAAANALSINSGSPVDSGYTTKASDTARNSSEPVAIDDYDGDSDTPTVTSRKRKLRELVKEEEEEEEGEGEEATSEAEETEKPAPTTFEDDVDMETEFHGELRAFDRVCPPGIVNPKSIFGERPAQKQPEQLILAILREHDGDEDGGGGDGNVEYYEYGLEDFCFYTGRGQIKPSDNAKDPYPFKYPWEFIRLSAMHVVPNIDYLFADGFLVGEDGVHHYFERMKVDVVSVSYDDPFKPCTVHVQSSFCSNDGNGDPRFKNVWYKLGAPVKEYRPYYEPFRWLAQLGLHFFAYLESRKLSDVTLLDFKDFGGWLEQQLHARSDKDEVGPFFFDWWKEVGSRRDFRNDIATHKDWLWNQAFAVEPYQHFESYQHFEDLTLWKEIKSFSAIPPAYASGKDEDLTVVTPYVYEVFKEMYGPHLKKVAPPGASKEFIGVVMHKKEKGKGPYVPHLGDVVQIMTEEKGVWSKERAKRRRGKKGVVVVDDEEEEEEAWYGYVTKIIGERLWIVWIYRPKDTILGHGRYPYKNELFFSDHCNCDEESSPLYLDAIIRKVPVVFNPKSTDEMASAEFFIRQKLLSTDNSFVTMPDKDLELGKCQCTDPEDDDSELPGLYHKLKKLFPIGSTVLYFPQEEGAKLLEPAVVLAVDDLDMSFTLRKLVRAVSVARAAQPNELLWTQEAIVLDCGTIDIIARRCYITVVRGGARPETPYDRGGIGDLFYLSGALGSEGDIAPLPQLGPEELREGWRLTDDLPKNKPALRGMDLFCGGGNFGRGLEEGGAVQMKWAVDFDKYPLHSYRANLNDLDATKLYLGSINNYLEDAICGRYSEEKGIPAKDQVDFISAGSPCQGFSLANNSRNSVGARRKQSLVCSLATAIDLYRPTYALLENVNGIATSRIRGGKEENTYTEMLCAIVGMGYQVQSFFCDAWSHGNCQSRTRLILAISKAGYKRLDRPPRSHQHGLVPKSQALYEAPNGLRFACREIGIPTPFPFPDTESCWGRLPNIGNGHVGLSIRYPDHISAGANDTTIRHLMAHVPRFMKHNTWRTAINTGRLHPVLHTFNLAGEKGNDNSRTYSRVHRNGLCRTITTTPTPQCSRTGRWMHPDQNRLLTIQEARIAQGYPDEDVLIGAPANKLHVIGNSVARGVSLALGIAAREAYLESFINEEDADQETVVETKGDPRAASTDGAGEPDVDIGALNGHAATAAAAAEQALQADAHKDAEEDACSRPAVRGDTDLTDLVLDELEGDGSVWAGEPGEDTFVGHKECDDGSKPNSLSDNEETNHV